MLTDAELREMRERCDRATPGEWTYDEGTGYVEAPAVDGCVGRRQRLWDRSTFRFVFRTDKGRDERTVDQEDPDGDFIAAARADVPKLLEEVERLRNELSDCRATHTQTYRDLRQRIEDFERFNGSLRYDLQRWVTAMKDYP